MSTCAHIDIRPGLATLVLVLGQCQPPTTPPDSPPPERPPVPGVFRVTPPGLDALLAARGVDPVVTGTAYSSARAER